MTKKLFLPLRWYEICTKGEDPILHFRLQPTTGFSYKAQRRKEERACFLFKRENKLWAVMKLCCYYFKPSYKSVYLLDELIAVIHIVNLNRGHLSLFCVSLGILKICIFVCFLIFLAIICSNNYIYLSSLWTPWLMCCISSPGFPLCAYWPT